MAYSDLLSAAEKILFNPDGSRCLPYFRELDTLVENGVFLSDIVRGNRQLYFIPTVEWIRGLIRLFKCLRVRRVVEIGAGDGFVAACLEKHGFSIIATDIGEGYPVDYGSAVERLNHTEAINRYNPELVFWCWPPQGAREPQEAIRHPSVKFYLDIGDGGYVCGNAHTFERFENRYLKWLSRLAFTWIDISGFRHNRNSLFFGHAHERYRKWPVREYPGSLNLCVRS